MNRPWLTWSLFAVCLAVVAGAMVYFIEAVMQARRRAAVEENARLALWRIDTQLAAIITRENSLPFQTYFDSTQDAGHVRGRFRLTAAGLRGDAPPVDLSDLTPQPIAVTQQSQSKGKTQRDFQQRAQINQQLALSNIGQPIAQSPFQPQLIEGRLLLIRTSEQSAGRVVDGATLDWPALRDELLQNVRDLLPDATLRLGADESPYRLTVIPASLLPGAPPPGDVALPRELILAWLAVALAAVAAGALLHVTLRLSQRRAAFVSAVTHELRTPLTTFRLYTQMLRENRVADDDAKRQYLDTLNLEADRLTHLVDNVLAHARLERGKPPEALQTVTLDELVARAEPRLNTRAAQSAKVLAFQGQGATSVKADPAVAEQILLNLIDNACKYGGDTITLTMRDNTLTVTDTGPGVAADVRKRLFAAFAKSAQDAAASAPGVGLGLALSRRLARAMRGDLTFQAPNTFTLTLTRA